VSARRVYLSVVSACVLSTSVISEPWRSTRPWKSDYPDVGHNIGLRRGSCVC